MENQPTFDVATHIREKCEALLSTQVYSHSRGICYYILGGLDMIESRNCSKALLQAFAEWPECHRWSDGTPTTAYPVAGAAEYRNNATSGKKWDANTIFGAKRWRLVRYLAEYFSTTPKEDE